MTTDRGSGGRSAFFGLALLILGGLLFAAGVMVGRRMALDEATESKDSLSKIDQRDREPNQIVDGGKLVFPEVLDSENPETKPQPVSPKPLPAPAPKVVPLPKPAREPPLPKAELKARLRTKISLQVAAYGDRSQADSLVKKLIGQGHVKPHIVEREVPQKGTYYRVRVGPYSSKQQADRAKEMLEKDLRVKVLFILEN
jgi:cell division protein FtsN